MLNRLRQTREMERRFIADASHELRTPLSGIKLHAQLASIAADSGERDHELQFISQAVDRSSRLIEQMLTLARLEPGEQQENIESIPLLDLIGEIIGQLSALIDAQSCQIVIQSDEEAADLRVQSNRLLLHTLLRNLMDNAIRYGGREGELEIQLVPGEQWTVVRLLDRGPGIPEELLEQVTERFYRLAGQEIDGCGLGLSIATEAAANIGAELEISNRTDGAGLQVALRLPLT
jgi:two-component system sensor histidine kinase QseC